MGIRVRGDLGMGLLAAVQRLRDDIANAGAGGEVAVAMLEDLADFECKQNDQTFASEGAKSGPAWAALSPAYAAEKRKAVGNKKILQRTGELRKSLTQNGHPNRIARVRGRVFQFGTKDEKAAKHQEGGYFTEQVPAHTRVRRRSLAMGRSATTGRFTGRTYSAAGYRVGLPGSQRASMSSYSYVRAHTRRYNLPARPMVRKSAAQWQQLRLAGARVLVRELRRRTRGPLQRVLAEAYQGMAKPDPGL